MQPIKPPKKVGKGVKLGPLGKILQVFGVASFAGSQFAALNDINTELSSSLKTNADATEVKNKIKVIEESHEKK